MFVWFRLLVTACLLSAIPRVVFAKLVMKPRILSGQPATPHGHPYMAAIIKDNKIFDRCGGALISDQYVLTAAECVVDYQVDVFLGAHDIKSYEAQKQIFRIPERNKIVHPHYYDATGGNNIALLKLPVKVNFTNLIQKIELAPEESELFIGERATFMGWGYTDIFYQPNKLQQVDLTVIGNNDCKKFQKVKSTEICATTEDFVNVGNTGDPGGPLIHRQGNKDILIGIATCKSSVSRYGAVVFTRVNSFRKWINETTAERTAMESNFSMV